MPKLRLWITMSLDGFVAGPDQSVDDPLGKGGMRLHDWALELEAWRAHHNMAGGVVNESAAVMEEATANVGATIMGRNMFGGHPGAWSAAAPWNGWWGDDPPFHHPVFVLTHHAREPLVMQGGTTFHFVTDGPEAALERARRAAGNKDITLGGGAQAARQYLVRGLVDEAWISVKPILLGSGERLLEGLGDDLHGLALTRTVATPKVVHLHFAR